MLTFENAAARVQKGSLLSNTTRIEKDVKIKTLIYGKAGARVLSSLLDPDAH